MRQPSLSTTLMFLCACAVGVQGCGGYYSSKKVTTANFAGESTLAQGTAPLEMDLMLLGGPRVNTDVSQSLASAVEDVSRVRRQDKILFLADCGIVALHGNDLPLARRTLDASIAVMGQMTVAGEDEQKATSLTGSESVKTFKGEPHERVLTFLYRGVLFLAENDVENAQACFRRAALEDSLAVGSEDRANWLTVDLLELCCRRIRNDSSFAEFAASIRSRYGREVADYDFVLDGGQSSYALLLAVGRGPQKLAGKKYGQELQYAEERSRVAKIRITTEQGTIEPPLCDSVYTQAVTRGRRAMDDILANQANTKGAVDGVGSVAAAAGPLVGGLGGMALGLMKEVSWSVSDKMDTSADCRQLRAIPGVIYLCFGTVSNPGEIIRVEAVQEDGVVLAKGEFSGMSVAYNRPHFVLARVPY